MPAGRPSKYNDELLAKAIEYVETEPTVERGDDGRIIGGQLIHSHAGLAIALGINKETIWRWKNDPAKPEFSNLVKQMEAQQEQQLLVNGLTGQYQPTIAKLVLNKHGYTDKLETDNLHTHEFTGMSDDDLQRIIDAK